MCPSCGQNAPLVYRGVSAFCSACGKPRTAFTANAVSLRGKPAKIGGAVAAVAGWVVLAATLFAALVVGGILQAIFPAGATIGWIIGGGIATMGGLVSTLLLLSGRALRRSGASAAEAARMDALATLAANHGGIVTAQQASEALGCPADEADQLLTALAKQPDAGVTLEVDDDGSITYRFVRYAPAAAWPGEGRLRVDAPPALPGERTVVPDATPPARVVTQAMPDAPSRVVSGPQGTKLVPVTPGKPAPADEVLADEGDEAARRARS